MDVLKIIDEILDPLNEELDELRELVMHGPAYGRSWERTLRRYDEVCIKQYQTAYIKQILKEKLCCGK